ncbi:hypothetical protein HPB47_009689 [Ixodes persulcatus]|uniref:Uncharacterized protein n=1 Tax=Ixodes persulcatus TaxID=34615 RepID=A0AC60P1H1_IXOPE|nr:hypothetical protein HPB47_009689 [Ixodes persulcatus]
MEYKILLPPLPDGKLLENSLILHGDPSARPYRIDDFGPALKKIINPNELASLGAYQYNHVWLLTPRGPYAFFTWLRPPLWFLCLFLVHKTPQATAFGVHVVRFAATERTQLRKVSAPREVAELH